MNIIKSFVIKNKCYQVGAHLTPRGLMLHSVGCPQDRAAVFAKNFNQYQPNGQSVCVHAFAQSDGTVYQTLPWDMVAWHCGGSANQTHIGVEMTEPNATMSYAESAEQITGTYHTAVELFAQLCAQYGLDPLEDGVIIGHAEGHRRGVASNHADPEYLWNVYGMGYTMDGFRRDVAAAMAAKNNTDEEDDDMATRYNTVAELPAWAREETQRLVDRGALLGDEHGNLDVTMDMLRTMIVCQRMVDGK
nr:MAG TPA: PGRP protein [Caudoviricetes sp.]